VAVVVTEESRRRREEAGSQDYSLEGHSGLVRVSRDRLKRGRVIGWTARCI
jgi:hypothetical protein